MQITNAEYHNDSSRISKSGLDLISKTPAHYWSRHLDPNRPPRPTTVKDFFADGTAAHAIICEPEVFNKTYVVRPGSRMNAAELAAFSAAAGDRTVIDLDTYRMITGMRDSVFSHPIAAELLRSGRPEQTIYWTDPMTGAACKCRPDWESDMGFLVDIKTTNDVSPGAFARSSAKYRYYVQDAFYTDGFQTATGRKLSGFVLIAVEKEPPYQVAIYTHDPEDIALGRKHYIENLETYVECLRTGHWPSYKDRMAKVLKLPTYLTNQQ